MPSQKIPHLLLERGRYYYQRKVPLLHQETVGKKKWRKPVGADYLLAVDEVRELTKQHNYLLAQLQDTDFNQNYKTKVRQDRERLELEKAHRDDEEYRVWLKEHGVDDLAYFGEDAAAVVLNEEMLKRPWESAKAFIAAIEAQRKVESNPDQFLRIVEYLEGMDADLPQVTVPPFPEYQAILEETSDKVKAAVSFLPLSTMMRSMID